MYAIVKTGGKQYRVEEGRAVNVEKLPVEEGGRVELNDVLLIADDGDVLVGTPTIDGARVLAEVEAQGRDKKIIVFKYKAKVRTRKKTGHRQPFTRLLVQEILRPGQEAKKAAAPSTSSGQEKRRRAKKAEEEVEAAVAEAPAAEAPATEAPAEAPKRRARKAAAPKAPPASAGQAEEPKAEAPKRRAPRKKAAEPKAEKADEPAEEKKPSRRRSTKKKDE